jgi:glycosyltransferase involved in cell wall biosynthesis
MDSRAAHLRRALTGVDLLLAPTAFARARALEFLAGTRDPATVRHLTLGAVDGPAQPRRAGPRLRFGYIGTLAPHKGLHVLLDAFRQLDHPEASLDVFGNPAIQPAYVARLQQSAASDSRIRFGGGFPEGGQAQALAAIDVLVIPSLWWENSPLTALEALCAGLPVIASRTGGVPELIADGDTGVLVTPGDVRELTGALADVASGTRLASSRAPVAQKTTDAGARELALLYESLR